MKKFTFLLLMCLFATFGLQAQNVTLPYYQDFTAVTDGNTTSSSGSGNAVVASSLTGIASVSNLYAAGGVVKAGNSGSVGGFTTEPIDANNAVSLKVSFKAVAWVTSSSSPARVKITYGAQEYTVDVAAPSHTWPLTSSDLQNYSVTLNAQATPTAIQIETMSGAGLENSVFIDDFVVKKLNNLGMLNEDFEGELFPPAYWQTLHLLGSVYWVRERLIASGDTNYCASVKYGASTGNENWIITPKLLPESGQNLSFKIKTPNYYNNTTINVVVSTASDAPADFTTIVQSFVNAVGSSTQLTTTWTTHTIDLSAYVGQEIYVGFQVLDRNGLTVHLDDVTGVSLAPIACVIPSVPSVTVNAYNSISLNWQELGSATSWIVEYSTSPVFASDVISQVVSGTPALTLTSLVANTNYYVRVKADCFGGDLSNWSSIVSFRTPCSPTVSAGWTETFNGIDQNNANAPLCWTRVEQYVSGTSIYPRVSIISGHEDSYSLHFYSNTSQDTLTMATPQFSGSVSGMEMSFWLRHTSTASALAFEVGVMSDPADSTTFVVIEDVIASINTSGWTKFVVNMAGAPATHRYVAFRMRTSSTGVSYYLDDINVYTFHCAIPTNLAVDTVTQTTMKFSFADDNSQTSWQYAITSDASVISPDQLVPATIGATVHTVTGLNPNTEYRMWIRTNCTSGGNSAWSEPISFRTACSAVDSISENFESYATTSPYFIPTCWKKISSNSVYPCVYAASASVGLPTKSIRFMGSKPQYLILPQMNDSLSNFVLDFRLNRGYESSGKFQVGYMSDPNDVSTFVPVVTYNDSEYQKLLNKRVYFSGVADNGSNRYIAFRYGDVGTVSTSTSSSYSIDSVEVWNASNVCLPPSSVRSLYVGHDSVVVAYDMATSVAGWEYVLGSATDTDPSILVPVMVTNDTISITTGLSPNTTYKLWIKTVCATGEYSQWMQEPFVFKTICEPYSVVSEDFESYSTSSNLIPNCWAKIPANSTYPKVVSSSVADGVTSKAIRFASTRPQFLIMQKSDEPLSQLRLSFKLNKQTSTGGIFQVGYMSDVEDTTTFVPVASFNNELVATYMQQEVFFTNVPDNSGANRYIAFRYGNVGSVQQPSSVSYWIDDVVLDVVPACLPPSNINFSFADLDSAVVYFTPLGSATQWQYAIADHDANPDTLAQTTVSNDSIFLSGLLPNATYRVWVRSDCGSGAYSNWTLRVLKTAYCTPAPTGVDGNGITKVRFGQNLVVNNVTGNEEGRYGDYSAMVGDASKGQNINVDITYGTSRAYGVKIYVDWNRDYDFDDTDELVYTGQSEAAPTTTLRASFLIPSTIANANYRMRIVTSYDGNNNPCYSSSYGCVEDYTIQVVDPLTCMYPSDILINNITADSADIAWTAGASETSWHIVVSPVELTPAGLDTAQINTVTSPLYQATGLLSNTQQHVYVRASCGTVDGVSPWIYGTFATLVATVSLPYTQDFSSNVTEIIMVSSSSTNKWFIGSAVGNTGNSMYISNNNGTSATYANNTTSAAAVVKIAFDNSPKFEVSFDWQCNGELNSSRTSMFDGMKVYIIPDSMELPATWSENDVNAEWLTGAGVHRIGGNLVNQKTWTNFSDTLPSSFANTTRKLVFMWKNDASAVGAPSASIDNISLYGFYCDAPTNIVLDTISHNVATINWQAGGTEQSWMLEYRKHSDSAWTQVTVNDSTYFFSGLEANTLYYVRIKAVCGAPNQYGRWANFEFITECGATTIGTSQVIYNFENVADLLPMCWTRALAYTYTDGKVYPMMERVSSNGLLVFKGRADQMVVLPRYAEQVNTLELEFDLVRRSTTGSGTLELGVMSNPRDATTFIPVHDLSSLITVADDVSQHFRLQLSTVANGDQYIAFRQSANSSQINPYYLDNLDVHVIPTCVYPENILVEYNDPTATSVDISWSAGGSEQTWVVEHRQASATEWISDTVHTTAAITINNLTPSTNYVVRIKAICATGFGESFWSSEVSFRTPCAIESLPFTETFSTSSTSAFPPTPCWNKYSTTFVDNIATSALTAGGGWSYSNNGLGLATAKTKLNIYGTSVKSWLVTPSIQLGPNSVLEFDMALTKWNSGDAPTATGPDDRFMVIVSTDAGQTWSAANATVWNNDGTGNYVLSSVPTTGTRVSIDLSQYSGIVRIAFYGESTITNADVDLHLDSISIKEVITVPPTVETQAATDITNTSATLNKLVTAGTHAITSEGFYYKAVSNTRWAQSLSGSITGLAPGTAYEFYAYADVNGTIYRGDTLQFTTTGTASIPPTVTTEAATNVTQTTATLHKTVTADPSEPVLTEGWKYRKATASSWATSTSGQLTGLDHNSTYEFYAFATTAVNAAGYNGATLTFTTPAHTQPTVVTGQATDVQCNSATLVKTVTPGTETITEEGWYYRRASTSQWIKTTSANISNLVQNTTYEYYAYATTASYPETKGATLTFTTPPCTGLDIAEYAVQIYPNPATNVVTIAVDGITQPADVTIVDITGKTVGRYTMANGTNSLNVDVTSFAEGTYVVRIVSDNINTTKRLVVKK